MSNRRLGHPPVTRTIIPCRPTKNSSDLILGHTSPDRVKRLDSDVVPRRDWPEEEAAARQEDGEDRHGVKEALGALFVRAHRSPGAGSRHFLLRCTRRSVVRRWDRSGLPITEAVEVRRLRW